MPLILVLGFLLIGLGSFLEKGLLDQTFAEWFDRPHAGFVIKEIGIVCIIAVIASATIERARLHVLLGEIRHTTDDALGRVSATAVKEIMTGHMPKEFADPITESVANHYILRRNYHVTLTYEWSDGNLHVEQRVTYEIENCSGQKCSYHLETTDSAAYGVPIPTKIESVKVFSGGSEETYTDCGESVKEKPGFITFTKTINLDVDGKAKVDIVTSSGRLSWGEEPLYFIKPTLGLTIDIKRPSNLDVFLDSGIPGVQNLTKRVVDGIDRYEISNPILPMSTVVVTWRPLNG